MQIAHRRAYAQAAIARLSFNDLIRKGRNHAGTRSLANALSSDVFQKFNPNHDAHNGQFTSGGASSRAGRARVHVTPQIYQGVTASGLGSIRAVTGGYFDTNGRYVPETFAPDPYALTDPASAFAHYIGGSGEPRNFYFGALDTSSVTATSFPQIRGLLADGKPGLFEIHGSLTYDYDSGVPFSWNSRSAAYTIGRLPLTTDGVLAIHEDGRYSYNGILRPTVDTYDFNPSTGRAPGAEPLTTIGRMVQGTSFLVHVIGSKPLSGVGQISLSPK